MATYALLRKFVLCLIVVGAVAIVSRPASAGVGGPAAATANQGLNACATYSGQQLRGCVADVLDRLADTSPFPSVTRSLHTAAAGVRAATNKAQALSAIAVCQAMVATSLKTARASGSEQWVVDGWGREAQVLAHAASLIQTKG
jgi:hypothetical protein